MPASTKSTGGGGYTFADKVAAGFCVQILNRGFPFEPDLGPVVGLHFETRDAGLVLDDLLVILEHGSQRTRCAISVKSNEQLTARGFTKAFVHDAWRQYRQPPSQHFDPETDLLGLVVGTIDESTLNEWRGLSRQAVSTELERLVDRLANPGQMSAVQRAMFDSLHDPDQGANPNRIDTAQLARRVRVLPFPETAEGACLKLCAEAVIDGSVEESAKLWGRLQQIAADNRGTGGSLDHGKLVRLLRSDFDLRDYPDAGADWRRIDELARESIASVRSVLGEGVQLPRTDELTRIRTELAAHDVVVLAGESGCGKSSLVSRIINPGAEFKRALWVSAELLSRSSQREIANQLNLRNTLPDLIHSSSLEPSVLVLDALEKFNGESRRRVVELIRAAKNSTSSGWKLIVTCQTHAWADALDMLIEAGCTEARRVDIDKPTANEIYEAIPHLPEIRVLFARHHLQPILRNLVMLDWVLRADIAQRLSDAPQASVAETDLINWIWQRWIGTGSTQIARDSLLRTLARAEGNKLSEAVHVDEIDHDQLELLGTLRSEGLVRVELPSVQFQHDLMGDWARFRILSYAAQHALDEIRRAAPIPRWSHAIRLYAQFLAEKGDGLEAWSSSRKLLEGTDSANQLASHLFLDGLLFAANSKSLLESGWARLISNDGALLVQLLKRLQHSATIPDFRLRLLVDPQMAEQSEAWARIPLPVYWVPALAVFSQHADDVAALALLPAAEACALWLRTIPGEFDGRGQAGLLALELAKEVQGRIAEGIHFEPRDQIIYEALLSAAPEFPNEVSKIALESCGRLPEPRHAIERAIAADVERERDQQEWLANHPEDARRGLAPTAHLHFYSKGEMRPPHADGPLRRVSSGFRSAVLDTAALKGLMSVRPEIAREVLLAVCIDEPKEFDSNRDRLLRRGECGVADWPNGYPAAYWKGPFLLFLQNAPEEGLDAVIRLVNYATDRALEEATGPRLTKDDHRDYGLEFEIGGHSRLWIGSPDTFGWHRSMSLDAATVECALMAIEKWLYDTADSGQDVSPAVQTILQRTESLAFAGVLISLGLKHPVLFTKELRPLLGNIHVYECQLGWCIKERSEIWTIALAGQPQVVVRMSTEWNRMPHRRFALQELVPWLMHQHQGTREYLVSRKPDWTRALSQRTHNPEALELLLAKLDPDNYTQTPEADGKVRFEMRLPAHLEASIKQAQQEGPLKMLALTLAARARRLLSGENTLTAENVPAFARDLERLASWQAPDGDPMLPKYRIDSIMGGVAVLVIQHRDWLAQHPQLESWCLDFLRSVKPHVENNFDSSMSVLDHTAESFRAEAGVALLQESSEEWVLRLVFDGITGYYYRSLLWTMLTAYHFRQQLGDRFDELVNAVVLWSALRRAAHRESMYQADSDLLDKYRERLFRRLVTGRLRGKLISLSRAEFLGHSLVERITRRNTSEGRRRAETAHREWLRENHSDRRLHRDLPDLDLEVLRKGFAFLPVMIETWEPLNQDRLGSYVRELLALEMRTFSQASDHNEAEIEGTANEFDGWILARIAEFIAGANSVEVAREFFCPILDLGPRARYWVQDFFHAWICRGLRVTKDHRAYAVVWTDMVRYAMSLPAWQPGEPGYWNQAESVVVDLMGLREAQTAVLGEVEFQEVVAAMAPVFEEWANQWLKYGSVAGWFAHFLTTPSGAVLLASGVKHLANHIESFSDRDWQHSALGPLFTDVLSVCWKSMRREVESDAAFGQAFLRILAVLRARQVPEALHFSSKVSESLIARALQ